MKNITIDYSLNGTNWTEVITFQLDEATGISDYKGEDGPHLGEIDARYILVTIIDTWGGDCAGLSEVRFDIEGTVPVNEIADEFQAVKLFPNPAGENISIDTDWDVKELIIVSSTGHEVARMPFTMKVDISFLPNGIYFLKAVNRFNEIQTKRFIKQGI